MPLQQVWPEIALRNRNDIAQVALLILWPQYRSKARLFWLLCLELWRYCIRNGINELWLAVPAKTRRLYWKLGWLLVIRGLLRRQGGEHCYPCSLDLHKVAEAVLRNSRRSALCRWLVALSSRDLPERAAAQSTHSGSIRDRTDSG